MALYLLTTRLTSAYFQGLLKEPSDREIALGKMYEAVGAKLEHLYFSPDTMESVTVFSCDDISGTVPLALAVGAAGILDPSTFHVRRILTGAELAEVARRTDATLYRPPGS